MLKYLVVLAAAGALSSCLLDVKYTVGGTVTGLTGTGLVLSVNSGNNLSVAANGTFVFGSGVVKGDTYSVTVATQPTNPTQTCTVYNGSGTVSTADVGNVLVTCVQSAELAYVANQTAGTISGFIINTGTGALTGVTGSPFASGGTTPVVIAIDPNGTYLYAVNNGSNDISVFQIDPITGFLTRLVIAVVTGNAPTSVAIHPNNQYMYVTNSADDTVTGYALSNGSATAISGATYSVGVDPVDVKIDPTGNYLYVANYTDGTISAFTIDYTTGLLTAITGSPFTAGGSGSGALSISIDPTDTLAYVANEKAATISGFSITAQTGTLVPVAGTTSTVSSPEALAISGNYLFVANVTSNNEIADYSIQATSGVLSLGTTVVSDTLPAAIAVDSLANYVYAANFTSGTVYVYGVNTGTGALTQIGSPIISGSGARSIAIH